MGPIDYIGALPQQDFLRDIQGGLQLGMMFRKSQDEKIAQQRALEAQQLYQSEAQAAIQKPTPQAFAALALKYPQHREAFKQGWDQLNTEQQQGELRDASSLAAALQGGRADVALTKLDERIAAMKNSGQDTGTLDFLRQQVEADPQRAYGSVLHVLSGLPGGEKVLENLGRVGTQQRATAEAPADLAQKQALAAKTGEEAKTAAITAKYADSAALQDLAKKGWDIKAIEADIGFKRESNRIAAMNSAISRANSETARADLLLKRDEALTKRDTALREKAADAESAAATMDNFLNTADRILNAAVGKDGKPSSVIRAATGPIDSRLPTAQQDVADLEALIETLGSQAFLSQIPSMKGLGALSNAEGEKLQSSLTNLSLRQSPAQLIANAKEAQRLIIKARDTLQQRTGVKLSAPDTPAAAPGGAEIDALLRKYGGG